MIDLIKREMDISKYVLEPVKAHLEGRMNDGWMDIGPDCLPFEC